MLTGFKTHQCRHCERHVFFQDIVSEYDTMEMETVFKCPECDYQSVEFLFYSYSAEELTERIWHVVNPEDDFDFESPTRKDALGKVYKIKTYLDEVFVPELNY